MPLTCHQSPRNSLHQLPSTGEAGTEKLINPQDLAQRIGGNPWPRRLGHTDRKRQYDLCVPRDPPSVALKIDCDLHPGTIWTPSLYSGLLTKKFSLI